ncbi:MAG: hypothetical protein A3F31_05190 [Candidatus Levybacteria bacterium RIFCSPHIGHO2_12_FULL_38_12]|nr:MAG: hypothetical protein A2770_03510 [Candidatus Levybacteria bacterium RIFCSPHIGHO2_01_FULL_38_12]OGH22166.1 MAG: hypothetical protein A3F31_05190 [Candidatus Levybacteria bacterium RIFCSPHIGHO2_12_FULL_38_12]OGH34505.1 MAG: hypothetical protein A3A47_00960 [Candidatus Levybacteria bacterium RIFCSPLOWO2_01_FULL_37_20]OGH44753.1 MAG: hypothetical protein A3J14_00320 [Candidatus Levybacteria bacterium RIFCSPLOWO2_02_FULL_37_18]
MDTQAQKARYPALTYRDFRLLWFGQFIANTGIQMQFVAVNWHLYRLTDSPVALGLLGLFRFLPIIIFSLIGGNFADAHNRKRILILASASLSILSFFLAFSTLSETINPFIMYTVSILIAVASSFDIPARQAFVPNLVKKEHLPNAISLNVVMFQASLVVGPALAGILIAQLGEGYVYGLSAVSFAGALLALFLIKTTGEPKGEKPEISIAAIAEGITFIKSQTLIWSTMLLDFFSTFFASATVLLPIFAKDILHVGPQGFGVLAASPAIGAVVAGFVFAHFGILRKQGTILLVSVGLFGIATIFFGISNSFLLSFLFLFIVGAGDSISAIIRNTIRQAVTPDYIRGRMSAVSMIFFMGGPQLGEFEAGLLAAWIGAPFSVVLGGIGTLIVVGLVAFGIPKVRNYQGHEHLIPQNEKVK